MLFCSVEKNSANGFMPLAFLFRCIKVAHIASYIIPVSLAYSFMKTWCHRNNSCDCLKELYYTLKTTTTRTTYCIVCNCVKEIKQMKQCSKCKRAQYCSQECTRAHHQDHKYLCKHWRALQEVDQELSFGMGYLNF